MTAFDHLGRRVGVVMLLSTLWAFPASADVAIAGPGASVAAEPTTCAAEKLEALSDFDAMALAPKRKRKPLASVRTPPTRLAALSQPGWNCTGPSCGRHFVLMIGIGY
jgi:hypothetical protein